jgi:hypothetical protein
MSLPNDFTPYTMLGGQTVDASMPRMLVQVAGSSGDGTTIIDANDNIFMMVTDMSTIPPTITYYVFGTSTVGTPVAPVRPYSYSVGSVTTPDLTALETDIVANGTSTGATPLTVTLDSKSTFSFTSTGTWTGTAAITGSIDGTNYSPLSFFNRSTGVVGSTFTANMSAQVNTVGLKYIKISGVSSGTMTVNYIASRLPTVNTAIVSSINGGTP